MEFSLKLLILILVLNIVFIDKFFYFPSFKEHIERNKFNIYPKGKLILINREKSLYKDENNIIWYKRSFIKSVFHEPFENYVFEEYDERKNESSEAQILKQDFDTGVTNFKPASYNYYSSIFHPWRHFVADVLPIFLYLAPKYNTYS